MRTRLLVLVAVVVILLGAGAAYWAVRSPRRPAAPALASNGPLYIENGIQYFEPLKPGQVAVFSEPPIENRSSAPLVIDRVALLISAKATATLNIAHAPLMGLPQRAFGGGILNQPLSAKDDGPWEAVQGAVIQPNATVTAKHLQGYAFIFVLDVSSVGMGWSTGVDVYYHIGSNKYVAKSNDLFVICTTGTKDCRSDYRHATGSPVA